MMVQPMVLSSLPSTGGHTGRPDYDLISRLRSIAKNGKDSLVAVEKYETEFPVKLAVCVDEAAAEALLGEWLDHRVAALELVQGEFRKAWKVGRKTIPGGARR